MDLKKLAKNTAKTLISYLTYEAVRVVIGQLRETNPPLCTWLHQFSAIEKIQDGDAYLQELLRVNQDLAFRIMTVRAHLASEVMDFMPEMVQTTIQQSNMAHRKQYLERITQLSASDHLPSNDLAEQGEGESSFSSDRLMSAEPDLDDPSSTRSP
ncbi:MAG: chaperonin family protein RbcX [Cyanobacteria bacterium P01_E01_bin.6]